MLDIDESEWQARIGRILHRQPAVGLALAIVGDGRLQYFHSHGLANIATKTPVTAETAFRIASITKTFTALAVIQLWEQGLVNLDAPANDYLRSFRLIPRRTGDRPATLRHLLTHTAGVPQTIHARRVLGSGSVGESFRLGEPPPTLAEYYRGGLRLAAEPGTTFTYGDHNLAVAGQIVEDVSGEPLPHYLEKHVFAPLGMTDTDLLRSARVEARLATGYVLRSRGARAVTDRQWVAAAAASIYSTPRDMVRYLAALLGGGANEHGRVLRPETLAMVFAPQYQPDPRVPGMGLGFFRASLDGCPAVEHQGVLPGFTSQIFLAPEERAGVMAFTNGARNAVAWLPNECGALLGRLIGAREAAIRPDLPHHPEVWADVCGRYRPCAQPTDLQVRSMFGFGVEVSVRSGRLTYRVMSPVPTLHRGFPLHPDDDRDPYVFRIDLSQLGMGARRVVFRPDPAAGTQMHLDLLPITLRRRPANRSTPRRPSPARYRRDRYGA